MALSLVASLSFFAFQATSTKAELGRKPPKPHKIEKCNSAKKAIVYYRTIVWNAQDELGIAHTSTRHAERTKGNCAYLRWSADLWRARAIKWQRTLGRLSDPRKAIAFVFGPYTTQALAVAHCESRLSIYATNGQYLGLFQMGNFARSTYGHSNTAIGQAKAAHKYFVASGKDWSPWSCKPW